jgi:hypothetical protein
VQFLSATRLIAGFQHEREARTFLHDLQERLRKFKLALHPSKTRLIRFGRHAAREREKRGEGSRKHSTSSVSRITARERKGPGPLSLDARREPVMTVVARIARAGIENLALSVHRDKMRGFPQHHDGLC